MRGASPGIYSASCEALRAAHIHRSFVVKPETSVTSAETFSYLEIRPRQKSSMNSTRNSTREKGGPGASAPRRQARKKPPPPKPPPQPPPQPSPPPKPPTPLATRGLEERAGSVGEFAT